MRAADLIRKKRDGGELSPQEIDSVVEAATTGMGWADYQLSAFLMAVCCRGMTTAETAHLTRAMTESGRRLDLSDIPGPKVDKHSTGGVGDKTSLILGPLAAACGVVVPMMSGRGLGHTGGTLDKLESIPGFRVGLTEAEFRTTLRTVGLSMIGQTAEIAPADKKLYALRDVTGTVESIPLITASILSKKLAEGISGLVLDVKCGDGAFMTTRESARALAKSLVMVGTANGLKMSAFLTGMDIPLGRAVGNALEVIEAIETLKGTGPADLTELSVALAARMIRLAGLAGNDAEAETRVRAALASGRGLEIFRSCIEQQRGDPRVIDDYSLLPRARHIKEVSSRSGGFLDGSTARAVALASMYLGAGRARAEDAIDRAVGVVCLAKPGDRVEAGQPIFEVHFNSANNLAKAEEMLMECIRCQDHHPPLTDLILEEIT